MRSIGRDELSNPENMHAVQISKPALRFERIQPGPNYCDNLCGRSHGYRLIRLVLRNVDRRREPTKQLDLGRKEKSCPLEHPYDLRKVFDQLIENRTAAYLVCLRLVDEDPRCNRALVSFDVHDRLIT